MTGSHQCQQGLLGFPVWEVIAEQGDVHSVIFNRAPQCGHSLLCSSVTALAITGLALARSSAVVVNGRRHSGHLIRTGWTVEPLMTTTSITISSYFSQSHEGYVTDLGVGLASQLIHFCR